MKSFIVAADADLTSCARKPLRRLLLKKVDINILSFKLSS